MIIVKLKGGLGNQMFQYAYGRQLSLRYKTVLKLDRSLLTTSLYQKLFGITPRKYEFGTFKIKPQFAKFRETLVIPKGNYYLDGYWQDEKYFKKIRPVLLKEFSLLKESRAFLKLKKIIRSTNSVSIHLRRGDYVRRAVTRKYHGVLDFDYYQKAIRALTRKVKSPHFFVFSDDIKWVKDNFKINYPAIYIERSYKLSNPEEMILMSLCQHNIIANSSFSWWAAWLNQNPRKIIISPKNWFKNKSVEKKRLIPTEWLKL